MRLLFFFIFLPLAASCSNKFPSTMPADFKIEYHLDGGMVNTNRTILLQQGECTDNGRKDGGEDYAYSFTLTDVKELETLYADLKKLNAFNIKYKNKGEVMDRGGESIHYTINGKDYQVNNSQSNFISKKDGPAFDQAIALIIAFAENHRQITTRTENPNDKVEDGKKDETDSISTGFDQKPSEGANNDQQIIDESISSEKHTGITPKMPNDFSIQYEMSAGISGAYRKIVLQYGSSTDEGKNVGESKYSKSWMNMNVKDYEDLYNALYKLDAFLMEYTTKGNVADRGGEMVTYTINGKKYKVSDKDQDYIISADKAGFKKATGLY
jgi:hypothetical protein